MVQSIIDRVFPLAHERVSSRHSLRGLLLSWAIVRTQLTGAWICDNLHFFQETVRVILSVLEPSVPPTKVSHVVIIALKGVLWLGPLLVFVHFITTGLTELILWSGIIQRRDIFLSGFLRILFHNEFFIVVLLDNLVGVMARFIVHGYLPGNFFTRETKAV